MFKKPSFLGDILRIGEQHSVPHHFWSCTLQRMCHMEKNNFQNCLGFWHSVWNEKVWSHISFSNSGLKCTYFTLLPFYGLEWVTQSYFASLGEAGKCDSNWVRLPPNFVLWSLSMNLPQLFSKDKISMDLLFQTHRTQFWWIFILLYPAPYSAISVANFLKLFYFHV